MRRRIAILASGTGSNAENLAAKIHALEQAHLPEIIQKLVESIA